MRENAADLPVYLRRIEPFLCAGDTGGQAFECCIDPPAELVVHGLLFAAPVGRATQDDGLVGLGMTREVDLDAFLDRAPTGRRCKRRGKLLQFRLGGADDVASAGLAQPGEVLSTRHAAIGDPDAS